MGKTSPKIHKTCGNWGETECGRQIFVDWKKRPRTSFRWADVTCKHCLQCKPKKTDLVHPSKLPLLVAELLDMLETVEESDSGTLFHPTVIRSCRCMHNARLKEIMPKITMIVRQQTKKKGPR